MANFLDEPDLFLSDDDAEKKSPEEKANILVRELRTMLYSYGDVKEPRDDTIELLQQMACDYIIGVCKKAVSINVSKKLALEDIHFLIRRDMRKFNRVRQLLSMSEELKKARKQFDM